MMQTDANCMVQLAAQMNRFIAESNSVEDLPRHLACYGIGFNTESLSIFIRLCKINFDTEKATSSLLYFTNLTPISIDKVIKFALGE